MIESQIFDKISGSQAMNSLMVLQRFFGQIGNNSCEEYLIGIHRKLIENTFKALKQTKITDFLITIL